MSQQTPTDPPSAPSPAPSAPPAGSGNDDNTKHYFDNYAEYSKTFRTWMVAYGIGAPVIFVTNEVLAKKVATSPLAPTLVTAFLAGVLLQVLLALLNKWCAWHQYAAEQDPEMADLPRFKWMAAIQGMIWIDILIDVVSLLAFVVATWMTLTIYIAPVPG